MLQAYKESWLYTFRWKRRMDRETYWKAMLIHILVMFVPAILGFFFEDSEYDFILFLCMMPFYISIFSVIGSTVQRLHDIGKSGWWLLLYYILGILGIGIFLLIWALKRDSVQYENIWGECPEQSQKGEQNDFVDERVSEGEVLAERNQIAMVLVKIIGFYIILYIVGYICSIYIW